MYMHILSKSGSDTLKNEARNLTDGQTDGQTDREKQK